MEVLVLRNHLWARSWGRLAALIFLSWASISVPAQTLAAENGSLEYAVKAAYLYKFGNFVEWPASAFENSSSAVNLCVAGDDPFGDTLDKAVEGQHIGDRLIRVRRLKTVTRDSGCQILYVGGSDSERVAQMLNAVRGTSVLTVTDAADTSPSQSVIGFVIKDDHVRFNIDAHAAAINGLTISSKLLGLALYVTPQN